MKLIFLALMFHVVLSVIAVEDSEDLPTFDLVGQKNLSQSSRKRLHSEIDSNSETNKTIKKPRIRRTKWIRPPGYRTKQNILNRRIVKLLKENGNGIYSYKNAKKVADEFVDQKGERNRKRMEDFRKLNAKPKGKDDNPRSGGYGSNDAIIERFMKTISKNDQTLTEEQVRKLAEEKFEIHKRKKKESQRRIREGRNTTVVK